jgi:ferric-dicitrate binding protein FerR (iron transport regulator)
MQNERYFRDLVRVLQEARDLDSEVAVPSRPSGTELIARRFSWQDRNPGRTGGWRLPSKSRLAISLLATAASLGLVAAGLVSTREPAAEAPFNFGTGEVVTGAGEAATVKLGDGTIVRLAPESRLRTMGKNDRREVWLEGRAFFAVTKQANHPFVVRTHAGEATVLGTRFDISVRQGDLQLLVVDGSVSVAAQGESVDVTAQQSARATPSTPPVRVEVDSAYIERELSWLGDFLVFEGTPLKQVAAELSARYGIPVEVLDENMAQETVVGVFTGQSLENVAEIICRAVAAHCSIQPSRITISP